MVSLSNYTLKLVITVSLITIVFSSIGCSNSTSLNPAETIVRLAPDQEQMIKMQIQRLLNPAVGNSFLPRVLSDLRYEWITNSSCDPRPLFRLTSLGDIIRNPNGTYNVPLRIDALGYPEHPGDWRTCSGLTPSDFTLTVTLTENKTIRDFISLQ